MSVAPMIVPSALQNLTQQEASPEEILNVSIGFMRSCLQEIPISDLRQFWEVRQFCFPLFKQITNRKSRAELWGCYMELTRQGRQLRSAVEEESVFALEQIQLAVQDVSNQIQELFRADQITLPMDFVIPEIPQALKEKKEILIEKQAILHLLHLFGMRIQSLRQELILTPARMKAKQGLFQSLSSLGDQVFPLKKKIVGEVNEIFKHEIDRFAAHHFSPSALTSDRLKRQFFFLRNEIKQLQNLAKFFSLEPLVFSETRSLLSSCWDSLKGMEKTIRKDLIENKQTSSQNKQKYDDLIAQFSKQLEQGMLSRADAESRWNAIKKEAHQSQLLRSDLRLILQDLDRTRKEVDLLIQKEDIAQKEESQRVQQKKQEEVHRFLAQMDHIAEGIRQSKRAADEDYQKIESLVHQLEQLPVVLEERSRIIDHCKNVQNLWMETIEEQLDPSSVTYRRDLQRCLEKRKFQRAALKHQIEEYRKILASSSLEIERSLHLQQAVRIDKATLEHCEASIKRLEEQMRQNASTESI